MIKIKEKIPGKKHITRAYADKMVKDLLSGIEQVNSNPQYETHIIACVVFGSYLTNQEKIGDLDVCVANWPKGMLLNQPLQKRIDTELNSMARHIRGSYKFFQFHTWNTLSDMKYVYQSEGKTFSYKYLYLYRGVKK
jgi:predicted nucleotidyltransferase